MDVYKKMPIIRSMTEPTFVDEAGVTQSVTAEELAERMEGPPPLQRKKTSIPIPVVNMVGDYEALHRGGFEPPVSYIRAAKKAQPAGGGAGFGAAGGGSGDSVDYVLGKKDVDWLNARGRTTSLLDEDRLELMIDILEKATALGPAIPQDQAEQLLTSKLGMQPTSASREVVADVYLFWLQRRTQLKKPLLRTFWPSTAIDDTNPHMVFRPREKERYKLRKHRKNDMESFRRMQQLRRDCEKLRHILELVRHREEAKRLGLKLSNESFDQQLYELENPHLRARAPGIEMERVQAYLAAARDTLGEDLRRPSKRSKKDRRDRKRSRLDEGDDGYDSDTCTDEPHAGDRSLRSSQRPAPSFMEPYAARISTFDIHKAAPQFCTISGEPIACWNTEDQSNPGYLFACRGRIGRGGRVVFDRIRRSPDSVLDAPTVLGLGQAPPRRAVPPGISRYSALHVDHARLAQIYSMSDSEDEEMKKSAVSHGTSQAGMTSKFELRV